MVGRACTYLLPSGRPCRATPLRDEPYCFWHAPETAEEAAEARRIGGLHRRKKKTVASIYGFGGLRTIEDNQALLGDRCDRDARHRKLDCSQSGRSPASPRPARSCSRSADLQTRIELLEAAVRHGAPTTDDPFGDE